MTCINAKLIQLDGYSRVRYLGEPIYLHRKVYHETHGTFPEVVHHTCNNKSCVNPEHLVASTLEEHSRNHHIGLKTKLKKFCKHGHEFTEENTYIQVLPDGKEKRGCRSCQKRYNKEGRLKMAGIRTIKLLVEGRR